MTKEYHFILSQKHLSDGVVRDSRCCPVARCINETLGVESQVFYNDFRILRDPTGKFKEKKHMKLNDKQLTSIIEKIDYGKEKEVMEVLPFLFTLLLEIL